MYCYISMPGLFITDNTANRSPMAEPQAMHQPLDASSRSLQRCIVVQGLLHYGRSGVTNESRIAISMPAVTLFNTTIPPTKPHGGTYEPCIAPL
jgi:hypothetical protein